MIFESHKEKNEVLRGLIAGHDAVASKIGGVWGDTLHDNDTAETHLAFYGRQTIEIGKAMRAVSEGTIKRDESIEKQIEADTIDDAKKETAPVSA